MRRLEARKTPRLVDELQAATWKRSKDSDADFECEFAYRPEGWDKAFRFRDFVTNLDHWTTSGRRWRI